VEGAALDALAADQASADELACIAHVDLRAGRTDRFAAVAARNVQHGARFACSIVGTGGFTRGQVDRVNLAMQPYRVRTRARAG
jgi:hypothetical protein